MKSIEGTTDQFKEIASLIEEIANNTKIINDIVLENQLLLFNTSKEIQQLLEQSNE